MKFKILSILVVFLIAAILPVACNADKGQSVDTKSHGIVNSDNPGVELDILKYLIKGKTNIVDFYSDYCPPCRKISPYLSKLDKEREDIVVIKVNINRPGKSSIDFASPLAKQYGLRSIPHFKIYDGEGKLLSEGIEAHPKVMTYLRELEAKK